MRQAVGKAFFALIRFSINDVKLGDDEKNLITLETLPILFQLAKNHDVAHLVGDALDKNGLLPDGSEVKKRFIRERDMSFWRYEQQRYELENICKALENAKIKFIPLKGSVLRKYYKEPWMRTSCDIDVLVHKENLTKAISELQNNLNYSYESTGNHDAHLYSKSGVHLELHYQLNHSQEKWTAVLDNVWNHLHSGDVYHAVMTNEMFYFYHIAHMAEHFKVGGCGVRSFLDLHLLKKHVAYNQEVLAELLEKGGLKAFDRAVCALADYWFTDGEESPVVLELNDFILNAGMYGDMKNRVAIEKAQKKSKIKVLFSRIFLPYSQLKYQYPNLQKHPIFYPFYVVKRWFKLLKKENRVRAKMEFVETTQTDSSKQKKIANLLKDLEL